MRKIFTAVALIALAGCTTPGDLLKSDPLVVSETKKDPKEFALCVYPEWQEYQSTATMSETTNGYRLVSGSEMAGQTNDVLDIKRTATGSTVRLYQRMAWQQVGRSKVTESLNRCL